AEPSKPGRSGGRIGHRNRDRRQCQCGQDHSDAQLPGRRQSADGAVGIPLDVLNSKIAGEWQHRSPLRNVGIRALKISVVETVQPNLLLTFWKKTSTQLYFCRWTDPADDRRTFLGS